MTKHESISVIDADPSDDRILECAVAAAAEVILSGDKHLLALTNLRRTPALFRDARMNSVERALQHGAVDAIVAQCSIVTT